MRVRHSLLLLLPLLLCPTAFSGRTLLNDARAFTCPQLVSWYASHPELPRPDGGLPVCYAEDAKADLNERWVGFDVDDTFDLSEENTNLNRQGCELDKIKSAITAAIKPKTADSQAGFVLRLVFHQAGTFDKATGTGGVNGAAVRLMNERGAVQNMGLDRIIGVLDGVRNQFPGCITRADLWTLAGAVAVEASGGPSIPWRPGRRDFRDDFPGPLSANEVTQRLPNTFSDFRNLEILAGRYGISTEEMVALMGGHTLGKVRFTNPGVGGSWTNENSFTNRYYQELLEEDFPTTTSVFRTDSEGRHQFMNVDLAILQGARQLVQKFANDQGAFFSAFASVWSKFLELGATDVLNNFQSSGGGGGGNNNNNNNNNRNNNNNNNNNNNSGGGGGNNGGSSPRSGHPVCKGKPDKKAHRDSQGRLWGWEDNASCMFPSEGGASSPSSPQTGPDGHAVCQGTRPKEAPSDKYGRVWGYENGKSCVYAGTFDGLTSDLFDLEDLVSSRQADLFDLEDEGDILKLDDEDFLR